MMKTKKLFLFLFASMLLCSCSCLLSQIPPQYIYAGAGCTALLPDYKPQVTVTGGCTGFTVVQTPAVGTVLTATSKTATVVIKATGTNGKSRQIQFVVTMLDTVTPKLTPTGSLVAYHLDQDRELYDAADKVVDKMIGNTGDYTSKVLIHTSWDSLGYRKGLAWYGDSLVYPLWVDRTTPTAAVQRNDSGQTDRLIAYLKDLQAKTANHYKTPKP
jgi:hypothetical protein